jgi:hypothetical protein
MIENLLPLIVFVSSKKIGVEAHIIIKITQFNQIAKSVKRFYTHLERNSSALIIVFYIISYPTHYEEKLYLIF